MNKTFISKLNRSTFDNKKSDLSTSFNSTFNINTYDNLSGYGLRGGLGSGSLPNGKKLVRVYRYNNRFYDRPSDLVFYNKVWIPVADIPGVEKKFIIKSV